MKNALQVMHAVFAFQGLKYQIMTIVRKKIRVIFWADFGSIPTTGII